MTRRGRLIAGAIGVAVVAALVATRPPPPRSLAAAPRIDVGAPVVRGAYHVHTRRSDGSGTVEEVAAAAARAGLGFVVFTDHGDATTAPAPPAYRSGVLCIDGVEISTTEGHYVALGLGATPWRLAGDGRDVVADVTRFGGVGIAAHPDSPKPDLAWRDWTDPIDGLEWINLDTEWRDEPALRLVRTVVHYAWRPMATIGALIGDGGGLLPRWAALARERRVIGLGGVDAHARFGAEGGFREGRLGLEAPGYDVTLGALQLAVELDTPFSGDAARDAAALLASIRGARVSTVIAARAAPGAIRFEAARAGITVRTGATLPPGAGGVVLRGAADAPEGSVLRLTCDGRTVAEGAPATPLVHALAAEAGVASCQMIVGWPVEDRFVHWVVTNPIWLRAVGAAVSAVASPSASASVVDLTRPGTWQVERDPASRASVTAADPGPGLSLHYAVAGGERRAQYVAFVLSAVEGLAQATAVRVTLSADRPMRLSLQVREPVERGDGRRWRRSLVVTAAAVTQTIPLDDLRPVDPGPARAPLDRVHAFLLVVDTVHTVPGAIGTIRLHQLAFIK